MKIALVGYRNWAMNIYDNISQETSHKFIRINSKEDFSEEKLFNFDPDFILIH